MRLRERVCLYVYIYAYELVSVCVWFSYLCVLHHKIKVEVFRPINWLTWLLSEMGFDGINTKTVESSGIYVDAVVRFSQIKNQSGCSKTKTVWKRQSHSLDASQAMCVQAIHTHNNSNANVLRITWYAPNKQYCTVLMLIRIQCMCVRSRARSCVSGNNSHKYERNVDASVNTAGCFIYCYCLEIFVVSLKPLSLNERDPHTHTDAQTQTNRRQHVRLCASGKHIKISHRHTDIQRGAL